MAAEPQPYYNRIRAINDCDIMRLQCKNDNDGLLQYCQISITTVQSKRILNLD